MEKVSGFNSGLHLASGALSVFAVGTQITAHNIANVSTGDFLPQHVTYATGSHGEGVVLESVRKEEAALAIPADSLEILGEKRASGTNLAREFPHLISTQHAFEANCVTVRVADEMAVSLLNTIA